MEASNQSSSQPVKKQRTANYTADEKNILFSIIMEYKSVIENKKTDAVTWKEKEHNVASKFNAQSPSGVYRNVVSLCYDNSKKTTRKNVAHERMEFVKTGGGKSTAVSFDKNEDLILSIMNSKTVVGLSNAFDSDMVVECGGSHSQEDTQVYSQSLLSRNFYNNTGTTATLTATDFESVPSPCTRAASASPQISTEIEQGNNDEEIKIDWGDYRASNLKTPMKKQLKVSNTKWTSRRRPVATSLQSSDLTKTYSEIANLKLEMVGIQLEMVKEERVSKKIESDLQQEELRLNIEIKKLQLQKLQKEFPV